MRYNFLPSFARRKGRITKLQETNLSFLADYSLDDPNTLNNDPSFDKIALEIGFGNGEDFFSFAKEKTNTLFLASEVYKSGIGNLIGKIREHSLENIGIIRRKENISVQVVVKAFSLLIQNMIQVRDGHVSLMLKISNT